MLDDVAPIKMRTVIGFEPIRPTVPGEYHRQTTALRRFEIERLIASATDVDDFTVTGLQVGMNQVLAGPAPAVLFQQTPNSGLPSNLVVEPGRIIRVTVLWHPKRRPEVLTRRQAKQKRFRGAWWTTTKPRPVDQISFVLLGTV